MDLILVLIMPLIVVAVVVVLTIRRGSQFKQLLMDGVETTGVVAKKLSFSGRRHLTLRYAYRDPSGRVHAHKSVVSDEVWNAHEEGGSIAVVYSRSRPEISAPPYLVQKLRVDSAG